jgi:ABC-type sugar transport system substrate-binding protein
VQALIAQSPYTIGTDGVDQAYAALTGKPTTAKIGTKFTIITKDNLNSAASQASDLQDQLLTSATDTLLAIGPPVPAPGDPRRQGNPPSLEAILDDHHA